MWTGENDTKTISVDANRFENGAKQYCCHLETVQCVRGLREEGLVLPSDDQAIYSNKLTQGGGGVIWTPHRFSKQLHVKDQALACKQLWVS